MSSRQLLFKTLYRLGFVRWDGHPLPQRLADLIEGENAPPAGSALDIGCGTGDNSIYLVQARLAGHRRGLRRGGLRPWTLLSCGDEPEMNHNGKNPARHFLFARRESS